MIKVDHDYEEMIHTQSESHNGLGSISWLSSDLPEEEEEKRPIGFIWKKDNYDYNNE